MANEPERIRAFILYVDGLKVGTMESASYSLNGNDEQHITAEGVSYSDGTNTTEITCNSIVAISGRTQFITNAIRTKKYCTVQVSPVDGQTHTIQMRCTSYKFDTDNKTGGLKGSFTFGGGPPEVT